jgi:osmotically-inducible protein OsmY
VRQRGNGRGGGRFRHRGAPTDLANKGTTVNKLNINAIAIAIGLTFSAGATAQSMSKAEYKSGMDGIAAEYKSAKAACASKSGNAKDICEAKAEGKENVAKAELEARYSPSNKNRYAVRIAKAKADYSVAEEKCDDKSGNDKQVCMNEAKAAETRAIANAEARLKSADASKPARKTSTTSKNEGPGEYVDDSVITTKVKAAILEEPSLKSAEINVTTYKGIVELSGFVTSRADINKAVKCARNVKGVKSVKNAMIVKGQQ